MICDFGRVLSEFVRPIVEETFVGVGAAHANGCVCVAVGIEHGGGCKWGICGRVVHVDSKEIDVG